MMRLLCSLMFICALVGFAKAENWPRFRGANGSGSSQSAKLPEQLTSENIKWSRELPGTGYGSPTIWDGQLFLHAANDDGKQHQLMAFDTATGEPNWSVEFASAEYKKHKFNSFATSTPAVDDKAIYSAWCAGGKLNLAAVSHAGKRLWHRDDVGEIIGGHGFGTSPIVYEQLIVIARDNEKQGDSSLMALDCETGETVWEVARPGGRLNFATPCVYANPATGKDEIIFVNWPIGVTSIDPHTGKQLWEQAVFQQEKGERAVASPITANGTLYVNCAFTQGPKHLVAMKANEAVPEVLWRVDNNSVPHIPSLIEHDGLLFAWNDSGICTCYQSADGEKLWQKRIGGTYFGSPICVDGKLIAVNLDGELVSIAASGEFQKLSELKLEDACRSTPATDGKSLFVRTASHLFCIGE
ncbi:MAG: PQQ-binding-like beta-propeller repeat protein [Planctomycetaceae bacterium]